MVERKRIKGDPGEGGDYFDKPRKLKFIHSGCTTLDCVLGGGWPLGRVSNIVGDKAVGKTLLAIEACANFARLYPKGKIWYRETEAAFDVDYAKAVGLPEERVDFGPDGIDSLWVTIEDVYVDLNKCLDIAEKNPKAGGLYIIDSLDAIKSRAALKREPGEDSYGLEKQKILGELLAINARRCKTAGVHLMFVSQVRDKIGVVFGEKHTRSGGKSLDFYASQILWLSQIEKITKTVQGLKRPVGVLIKARCKKNKVGTPFGECEFGIRFGYGIEDLQACVDWLAANKRLDAIGCADNKAAAAYLAQADKLVGADYQAALEQVQAATKIAWEEVEKGFRPARSKYGSLQKVS